MKERCVSISPAFDSKTDTDSWKTDGLRETMDLASTDAARCWCLKTHTSRSLSIYSRGVNTQCRPPLSILALATPPSYLDRPIQPSLELTVPPPFTLRIKLATSNTKGIWGLAEMIQEVGSGPEREGEKRDTVHMAPKTDYILCFSPLFRSLFLTHIPSFCSIFMLHLICVSRK